MARFLAAELAHNVWSEHLTVTLVGFGAEIAALTRSACATPMTWRVRSPGCDMRCLFREVLLGHAVPVHRGVIEVGPELRTAYGLFRPYETLITQALERLRWGAVLVMAKCRRQMSTIRLVCGGAQQVCVP